MSGTCLRHTVSLASLLQDSVSDAAGKASNEASKAAGSYLQPPATLPYRQATVLFAKMHTSAFVRLRGFATFRPVLCRLECRCLCC